jgi:pimeloyl-ACP methyl ester carboxylesterase
MEHLTVQANDAAFHVAKIGTGRPLLLLHGWPEFWLSWELVMTRLTIASHCMPRTCAASAIATSRREYSGPTSRPPTCWR